MQKTFVGPQLRQLRTANGETQAQMATRLGISPAYVNLLESNQRTLTVPVLVAITESYGVDWKSLLGDDDSRRLPELRAAMRDPIFAGAIPDLQELRAVLDHSPRFAERFLQIYQSHRNLTDRISNQTGTGQMDDLLAVTPGAAIHDFFRDHENYFDQLEKVAERNRSRIGGAADDLYASLKRHLRVEFGISAKLYPINEMADTLRIFDRASSEVRLSEALDHPNRVFQLAHVLGLLTCSDIVDELVEDSGLQDDDGRARLAVELMNYFAGALLLPYDEVYEMAEATRYDIDRLASAFSVSFEQVCHRLTTLQRDGSRGVPFFFLRIDRAGNVTKRFNATPFTLAEQGGSCPVWNIHGAFRSNGVIVPQFVKLPGGGQFFTLSRTTDRPVFSRNTQDRRLVIALGCEASLADRVCYAEPYNISDQQIYEPIGISCHVCPRQACSQRAHQPINMRLSIDADRRGSTHHES